MFERRLNLSVAAVFLVCMATAWNGAKVLEFLRAADHLDRLSGSSDSRREAIAAELQSFIAKWNDVAGVADAARSLSAGVVRAEMPHDKAIIETAISGIVENSPTTDTVWQDLAEVRLARGDPMQSVLAAFHVSDLVGSHHGYTMIRRATFGLDHWSELPEEERRIAVRDMVGTIDPYFKPQERYRAILATKSAAERDDIRAAVTASGLGTPDVLRALGE